MDQPPTLPGLDLAQLFDVVTHVAFTMLRIGAFLLASPVFGGRFVPLPVRVVASVVLSLPIILTVDLPAMDVLASPAAIPLILAELAIGLSAGLVLTILFGAASLAGDRIATAAGLGFAAQFDPSAGGQTPVVSQFFGMTLLVVFLSLDGHLAALRILLDSYRIAPPGTAIAPAALIQAGLMAGGRMFALGLQIMMPCVGALLLINITLGVLTRSAPQLNIFSLGFPVTMTATIILLYITAPLMGDALAGVVGEALDQIRTMIAGLSDGRG